MMHHVNDDEISQWAEFWAVCSRLLTIYPERPAAMSGDAEAKQLERQLKELESELLPVLCDNDHWAVEASVGKGNWAAIPWVAFFDSHVTTSEALRQGHGVRTVRWARRAETFAS